MTKKQPPIVPLPELMAKVVLLTEEQAANCMQVHQGTLRNARCTGKLGIPFIKLSPTKRGKVRYRESDIAAWLDARTHGNTRQAVGAAVEGA